MKLLSRIFRRRPPILRQLEEARARCLQAGYLFAEAYAKRVHARMCFGSSGFEELLRREREAFAAFSEARDARDRLLGGGGR